MSKALPALVFKSHDGRCASEAVTAAQNTAGCCITTAAVQCRAKRTLQASGWVKTCRARRCIIAPDKQLSQHCPNCTPQPPSCPQPAPTTSPSSPKSVWYSYSYSSLSIGVTAVGLRASTSPLSMLCGGWQVGPCSKGPACFRVCSQRLGYGQGQLFQHTLSDCCKYCCCVVIATYYGMRHSCCGRMLLHLLLLCCLL